MHRRRMMPPGRYYLDLRAPMPASFLGLRDDRYQHASGHDELASRDHIYTDSACRGARGDIISALRARFLFLAAAMGTPSRHESAYFRGRRRCFRRLHAQDAALFRHNTYECDWPHTKENAAARSARPQHGRLRRFGKNFIDIWRRYET